MSNLSVFNFEQNSQIRIIMIDNNPWFVAKDICEALGLANHRDAISKLDNDEKGVALTDTLGGQQELSIINESGMYALVMRSRDAMKEGTPQHKFRKWVTSEVLPAIRKTGKYEARQIETLTPSTPDDRAPLRALVHAWSQVCGQPHSALWPQVKAHFQLSRIDDLPVEWLPDALAFVQSKIDACPKALPLALPGLSYREK